MLELDELGDSRTRILEILRKGRSTLTDLKNKLDISPTAIRQHLEILEKNSLVDKMPLRYGAGRPKYVYALTDKADSFFPKAYETLAQDLLTTIVDKWGKKELMNTLQEIAKSRGKELSNNIQGKTEKERLGNAVNIMNEMGYYIDLEKDKEGYCIKVHNCVFSNLIKNHESLVCNHDHTLFQTILDSKIKKGRSRTQGAEYCSFHLIKD
jgi:predicted ArsR family transcriptional regulator